jgi:hypothetical protein
MMDLELARQRREEVLREVATNRQAEVLSAILERRASRRSTLVWEIKRHTGRLRKLIRMQRKTG